MLSGYLRFQDSSPPGRTQQRLLSYSLTEVSSTQEWTLISHQGWPYTWAVVDMPQEPSTESQPDDREPFQLWLQGTLGQAPLLRALVLVVSGRLSGRLPDWGPAGCTESV